MTNLIIQENPKCSPGSKTPDWYDPDYKNETTPESQKELERIKQESLDKMKKLAQKNRKLSKLRFFYVVLFGRVLFL